MACSPSITLFARRTPFVPPQGDFTMKLVKRIPLVTTLLSLGMLASAQLANAEHLPYPPGGPSPQPVEPTPFIPRLDLHPDVPYFQIRGAEFIFPFGVKNAGTTAAGPFMILVTKQGQWGPVAIYQQQVAGLGAGQSLSYDVTTSCSGGGLFTFIVDATGTVAETFEFNNTFTLNIGGC
jgi:hypothetical protein